MSNAETVARWYEEAATRTDDEWVAFWAQHWNPNIEWRAIEGAPDDSGPMHGVPRLVSYYADWIEIFEGITTSVRSGHDVGDRAVLALHVTATSKSTGMPLELDYGVVLDFDDDGRILRGREFATAEEALAAAGAEVGQA